MLSCRSCDAREPFSGGAGFWVVLSASSPLGLCSSPPFVPVLLLEQLCAAMDQGAELGYK